MSKDDRVPLPELLKRADKGATLAKNVLTRYFRDSLAELNISERHMVRLIEVYLRDPARQIERNIRNETPEEQAARMANDRGNLKKEMERNETTYKVFEKLFRLLKPKDMYATYKAVYHDGFVVEKTYKLDLYPYAKDQPTDINEALDNLDDVVVTPEEVDAFYNAVSEVYAKQHEDKLRLIEMENCVTLEPATDKDRDDPIDVQI